MVAATMPAPVAMNIWDTKNKLTAQKDSFTFPTTSSLMGGIHTTLSCIYCQNGIMASKITLPYNELKF